jgi:putative DNA primase/helicase
MTEQHINESPVERVLRSKPLEQIKAHNGGYKALCPAHDDHNPSLSIGEGEDGSVLLKCFAGCSIEEILAALELEMRDLFPANTRRERRAEKRTTTFPIKDREGRLKAYHVRHDYPDGDKDHFWKQSDGKSLGLNGTPVTALPLYGSENVDAWPEEAGVVLVEGEKVKDALEDAGIKALATVTGAGSTPGREPLMVLKGHPVCLWPDNDPEGRAHMERIAKALTDVAKVVRWFEWEDAPEKGDAADHPALRSANAREITALRWQMAKAPIWEIPDDFAGKDVPRRACASGAKDRDKPQAPTHDELRDRFLADHGEDFAFGLGEWQRYTTGFFSRVPDARVKSHVSVVVDAAKPEGIKPTAPLVNSVAELAKYKVFVDDDLWDSDPDNLVCANGTLHIPTGELREHDRKHYATSAVPYDFDRDARAPGWNFLLASTVPECADFLQEFAGYSLTTDTSHEIALWLFGPPGSGRSTFLTGLEAMLGPRSGILGLADLERSQFALANVAGKTLMTATEQPSSFLASTNVLNALISGETIQVEKKFKDPYEITPRVKLAWAMNELPRVGDANSGIFRRVKVVSFPQIPPEERKPEVKEHIKGEGPGILNWAVEGLARLRERGHFEIPDAVTTATQQFQENNDVPALFIQECCAVDPEFTIGGGELYQEYKFWCVENGHRPQSSTSLADDWQRLGFERYRAKGKTRYRGVQLRLPGE